MKRVSSCQVCGESRCMEEAKTGWRGYCFRFGDSWVRGGDGTIYLSKSPTKAKKIKGKRAEQEREEERELRCLST